MPQFKKHVKTNFKIKKEYSLSEIEEEIEDVQYADNIFDKYNPPLLAVEAMVLEPLADPFFNGLEGIQLA